VKSYLWRCAFALLLMATCAIYYQYCESKKQYSSDQTRLARVQLQRVEQRVSMLEQHRENTFLSVLGEDFVALQIRLAEHLSSLYKVRLQSDKNGTQYLQTRQRHSVEAEQEAGALAGLGEDNKAGVVVSYRQSHVQNTQQISVDQKPPDTVSSRTNTLRVDVQIKVANTPDMLHFLRQLKSAAGGWPGRIRACEIHRSLRPGIDARCVMDFYHWTVDTDDKNSNS